MKAKDVLELELLPGEAILWQEEPRWRAVVTAESLLGSVFFAGFAAFAYFVVGVKNRGPLVWIWPALCLIAFALTTWQKAGTIYAITNKRVLKVSASVFGKDVESIYPWSFQFVRKTKDRWGAGSLIFAEKPGNRSGKIQVGLGNIRDVDSAEIWAIKLAEVELNAKAQRVNA